MRLAQLVRSVRKGVALLLQLRDVHCLLMRERASKLHKPCILMFIICCRLSNHNERDYRIDR